MANQFLLESLQADTSDQPSTSRAASQESAIDPVFAELAPVAYGDDDEEEDQLW